MHYLVPEPNRTVNPLLPLTLDQAELATVYAVHQVIYPQDAVDWPQRLEEVGFLPGERVTVIARGQPGNEPLAVRVGHSTFALRRAEAACVQVRPWQTTVVAR